MHWAYSIASVEDCGGSTGTNWINTVTPVAGTLTVTDSPVVISAAYQGISACAVGGPYTAQLVVAGNATNTPQQLQVTLAVNPASAALTADFDVSRSSGIAPLGIHFDAAYGTNPTTVTGALSGRSLLDCKFKWNFGDPWASGTGTWSTGSNQHFTKNEMGFAPWAYHVYWEGLANLSIGDGSTVVTVILDVTCMEDDGTKHTSLKLRTITIHDTIGASGKARPRWLHPSGSTVSSAKPAGVTAVEVTDDNLRSALSTEEAAGSDVIFVQDAAAGVWDWVGTGHYTVPADLYIIGETSSVEVTETNLASTSSNGDPFARLNANTVLAGVTFRSTDASNEFVAISRANGAHHSLFYQGGGSGLAGFEKTALGGGGAANYTGNVGIVYSRSGVAVANGINGGFVNNGGAGTSNVGLSMDMDGKYGFVWRASCVRNGAVFQQSDMFNHAYTGTNFSVFKWHDACADSGGSKVNLDADGFTVGWNRMWTGNKSHANFMHFEPQNGLAADKTNHERVLDGVIEGNLMHGTRDCSTGGSGFEGSIGTELATQNVRYRLNTFVDNRTNVAGNCNASSRSVKTDNKTAPGGCALPTPPGPLVGPDFDPPAGCVEDQLGGNHAFGNVHVNETDRAARPWAFLRCNASGTEDVDRCPDASNNLSVSNTGTFDAGIGEDVSTGNWTDSKDPDTYFTTYTDAAASNTLHVDDFEAATPDAGGNEARMFWGPDGVDATWNSFNAGLYQ